MIKATLLHLYINPNPNPLREYIFDYFMINVNHGKVSKLTDFALLDRTEMT